MKRILVLSTYFYPHVGGVENYIWQISRRLKDRGLEVDILALNTEDTAHFEVQEGINIYRIPCLNISKEYALPTPGGILQAIKVLRSNMYDVVNTHTRFYFSTFLGILFSKLNKIPLIHTEHGADFVRHNNPLVQLISRVVDHTLGRWVMSSANVVCGVSEASVRFAQRLGAKKVRVVYNAIDVSQFGLYSSKRKRKGKIIITFCGRLIYSKGLQDILRAISVLPSRDHVQLFVIGDGSYRSQSEELAGKQRIKNQVVFLGGKSLPEVKEILSITDIFINPSYVEGLPTSILEAGAMGLPVIATDVGGTGEIITDGITGLLYRAGDIKDLTDKIKVLIENENIRETLGRALNKWVRDKFDWDQSAEEFINILRYI